MAIGRDGRSRNASTIDLRSYQASLQSVSSSSRRNLASKASNSIRRLQQHKQFLQALQLQKQAHDRQGELQEQRAARRRKRLAAKVLGALRSTAPAVLVRAPAEHTAELPVSDSPLHGEAPGAVAADAHALRPRHGKAQTKHSQSRDRSRRAQRAGPSAATIDGANLKRSVSLPASTPAGHLAQGTAHRVAAPGLPPGGFAHWVCPQSR
jgi:hypothetical protein